jgi:uncharacterized membrane protein YraQ (UPF0718 family)
MFDWLQRFADWLVYVIFQIEKGSHLGDALNFFFYDTLKILILLFVITFAMGIVNAYFPVERIRNFLSQRKLYGFEYLFASVFGAATPFCSCSSVPLFIGFVRGGIPLGVTFSFLVTSPLVNEVAVAVLLGSFGLKTTAVYVVTGITLGVVSGIILNNLKLERFLTEWVRNLLEKAEHETEAFSDEGRTFLNRIPGIGREALGIVKSVLPYVVVGIAVGAAIHGYVPSGFFENYIGADTWYAVPLAVALGVPMYANATGIVPVIQVFVSKGVPIGTSLAFMMAVVGLSIPEAMLLKKVMTAKLIAIFFTVVAACIILSGYFFNLVL